MNYEVIYTLLINRARRRKLAVGVYCERHHIIPRCLGGADVHDNIVRLLPEEHYTAHQLLVKLYPGNRSILCAALAMTRAVGGRVGNKRYGWLKRQWAKMQRENNSAKSAAARAKISAHAKQRTNPMTGRTHTQETRELLSRQRKGRRLGPRSKPRSPEHCAKIKAARLRFIAAGGAVNFKGQKHTEQTRAVLSQKASEQWRTRKAIAEASGTPLVAEATRQRQRESAFRGWKKRRARASTRAQAAA